MAPAIRTSQSHGNDSMTDSRPSLETAELPAGEEKALPVPQPAPGPSADEPGALDKAVENVLHSDIGVNTLLNRLKQSVASARDFAGFLKKRSTLEEDQAQGIKKLCRSTSDTTRRSDARQGTYATQFEMVTRINDRMADNGMQFALSLHQMHEDLNELCNNMERGRKHWKQQGLAAEKRLQDADALTEKAKSKYDSLAEDLDRVRTGDKAAGGKLFGIKAKSGPQQEEDLQKKVQGADADYLSKVQSGQSVRQEIVNSMRPQAIKAIQELITECDSALTLQLQKFVSFNEKVVLGNGILIAPIQNPGSGEPLQPSLRDIVMKIDNDVDFKNYVSSFSNKVPPKGSEPKYEKHPTLAPSQQPTASRPPQAPAQPQPQPQLQTQFQGQSQPPPSFNMNPQTQGHMPPMHQPPMHQPPPQSQMPPAYQQNQQNLQYPQDKALPHEAPPQPSFSGPARNPNFPSPLYSNPTNRGPSGGVAFSSAPEPAPLNPVFGVSLDALFQRDGSPVPLVVYQCIQAVELYGMDVEGIYRVSGTQQHIRAMKSQFNNDATKVDFRSPEAFHHDVNSVAGLLKEFFRDLPDPLLTSEHYNGFIDAARIEDDTVRRDSMHAIINGLPDPNYATLRTLVLHLNRVQEHAHNNRMSSSNIAICFAPTMMGQHRGPISDSPLQAKVVDTILMNTLQIFDED